MFGCAFLNNLSNFEILEFLKDDPIFKLFFMEAEIANYSREEHWAYLSCHGSYMGS